MNDPQLLVYGRLIRKPEERTDVNGKPYTTALMLTEQSGRELRLSVISRVPRVCFTLQDMESGEAVALSGPLVIHDDENGSPSALGINARRILSNHRTKREKQEIEL
ncbi:hypothetical protein [Microbulbifer magnicolonia]|uniref:hypothetical protein n=1 Tax=Microbulbifer magnicolonia TaxID=3109744 RepID=UPI002B417517|nr:hypothetical protein [Microbulbifer sp. GG15]